MANIDIRVHLRGGDPEGELRRFRPGESVRGTVEVVAGAERRCNHLWVRLQWHTEGRGSRDQERVETMDLFQGTLRPGMPCVQDFSFDLPREPWSYAGHYITIVWEIFVDVDVPWSRNPRHSQPFVMAPDGFDGRPPAATASI